MIWLLALACASRDVAPPVTTSAPVQLEAVAPQKPSDTQCIQDCLRQNMARAVDHTIIEADCKRACSPGNDGDSSRTIEPSTP